jgi:hypothetical protein
MNISFRNLFLLLTCLFSSLFSFGQQPSGGTSAEKPIRIEIPAKSTDESFRIIPCGKNGLILFFKSLDNLADSATKWYFSRYDSELHQQWVKCIPVGINMVFEKSQVRNDTLSMLFVRYGKEKKPNENFTILTLSLRSNTFTGNSGLLPEELETVDFTVIRQLAFIVYDLKDQPAHLQIMDLQTGKSVTYPWTRSNVSKVTGFSVDTVSWRIRAALSQTSSFKSRMENYLVSMDFNGKILAEILIQPVTPNRYLRGLDFIPVEQEDWLVFGSYGTTPVKTTGKVKKIAESSGFFSCKLNRGLPMDINFTNLLELNNSKELLGEKDIISLKKKALKKSRNISEYSLDYPMLLHPVFRHGDQFILVAETFSPQYHSESFTDYDFYGRPYVNTYDVFDGYRFNNGIIAGFDKDGKRLWDNTMEIRNLLTYELVPKITCFFTPGDEIVLAYLSEGKIASKIIKGNDVVEKLDFSALDMANPEDKLLSESKSGMVSWYDHFFLCYGFQEIKNIRNSENKKRLVFYFTKISFD